MNQNKNITFLIGLTIITLAIGLSYFSIHKNDTKPVIIPVAIKNTDGEKEIPIYTVTTHAKEKDCWTTINGNVYNVTSWISLHPGGRSAIIGLCGTDGTDAFNQQHGGQGDPAKELAKYKIGVLKQ